MADKQQTAVEFLDDSLHSFIHPEHGKDFIPILEKAKAMEIEQSQKYAEFCVECDRKGMPLLDFKSWIEL